MARAQQAYVCQSCGAVQGKWSGRCDSCGEWNSLVAETVDRKAAGKASSKRRNNLEIVPLAGASKPPPRQVIGIDELDRALGGGLVPGSALLLGGDPGIGKSTLTLQAAAALASQGRKVLYVSGEESIEQIRLRAARLGLQNAPVELSSATSVRDITGALSGSNAPDLLIIDSIQTMFDEALDQGPGTVTQLRAATQHLIHFAKGRQTSLLLIGHVTKDGQIAGPRVLEHMVDTVLYFEGERGHQFRLLRAVKNRFGPANEIGVFEMLEQGLMPVANPSEVFLADHEEGIAGACVFAGIEGTRPLLVEIQALVAPSPLATPRRAVVGWDSGRLAMILAVLETRCGLVMAGRDVYLNVAGGLRINEPAADLAVAAALVSSVLNEPMPPRTVVLGEIGLAGEVRRVTARDARLKEAAKLGFENAILPAAGPGKDFGLKLKPLRRLNELLPDGTDDRNVA